MDERKFVSVDVDLVLYRFASFQPPAGEGEERIAVEEEDAAGEIGGVVSCRVFTPKVYGSILSEGIFLYFRWTVREWMIMTY